VIARRKARYRSVLGDLAAQRASRVAHACAFDMEHLPGADTQRWQAAIDMDLQQLIDTAIPVPAGFAAPA